MTDYPVDAKLINSLMRVKEELGTVRETVGAALEGRL